MPENTPDDARPTPSIDESNDRGFQLKKRRRWPIIVAALAVVVIIATVVVVRVASDSANASSAKDHFGTHLKVAYLSTDAAQQTLLDFVASDVAPKYGITVEPVGIGDPNQISQATNDGEVAATIYAHKPWIEESDAANGWTVKAVEPVFQWAYSVYSSRYRSLDALPDGATIGILDDPANTAQALMLLANAKKITLDPAVDPAKAALKDLAQNPHKYTLKQIAFGSAARTLDDFDAIVSYNFEFVAAGTPAADKIYAPDAARVFAGQLAIASKYLAEKNIVKLIAAFKDPAIAQYLKTSNDPHVKDQLTPVSNR